jgi:hypothetical protein
MAGRLGGGGQAHQANAFGSLRATALNRVNHTGKRFVKIVEAFSYATMKFSETLGDSNSFCSPREAVNKAVDLLAVRALAIGARERT